MTKSPTDMCHKCKHKLEGVTTGYKCHWPDEVLAKNTRKSCISFDDMEGITFNPARYDKAML